MELGMTEILLMVLGVVVVIGLMVAFNPGMRGMVFRLFGMG